MKNRSLTHLLLLRRSKLYFTDTQIYILKSVRYTQSGTELTDWAFIFPVIRARRSVSDIAMVQSAFLAGGQQRDRVNNVQALMVLAKETAKPYNWVKLREKG